MFSYFSFDSLSTVNNTIPIIAFNSRLNPISKHVNDVNVEYPFNIIQIFKITKKKSNMFEIIQRLNLLDK